MQKLSQRDSRWASQKLGFSTTTTIGSHGCTITCVAMLASLTPDNVNNRLKAVNGYANSNLIIWSKVKEAISWLEFEWRGYSYENDRVSGAITKNGGCLVEVDATPIGGTKHWVLYIGNQKLIDPWDGLEKPTSSYIATGYSILNKIGEPPEGGDMADMYKGYDLSNKDSMKVAVDILVRLNNGEFVEKSKLDELVKVKTAELSSKISKYEKDIENFKKDLQECQNQTPETPSVENYTKGFTADGLQTEQVYGNLTIKTNYKKG